MTPKPDMVRVMAAVLRYGDRAVIRYLQDPVPKGESLVPQDAAIRKPLWGPSDSCPGFDYPQFLNRDHSIRD